MVRTREDGQSLILFAVLTPILFAILGLAIEGGLAFFEYRHMQAAADMAALTGAQDLPNTSQAITDACVFSQYNGYDDCTSGAASTTTVCVPPRSLSPYNGLNYQEGNAACANTGSNNYIEVNIQKQMQLFPIFSNYLGVGSFTLAVHAIARHGTPSHNDYAMTILDHTLSAALTLSGANPKVIVGPVIANSNATDAILANGAGVDMACNGQWLTGGPENLANASQLRTVTGGVATFSPVGCPLNGQNGVYDPALAFYPNHPTVPDPYCTSYSPPITGVSSTTGGSSDGEPDCTAATNSVSSMSNCAPCNSTAWYYTWTTNRSKGTWQQASGGVTIKGNAELFPGIYPGGITAHTGRPIIYLNPGVYTIEGSTSSISMTGGDMCIYGAPVCDVSLDGSTTIPGKTANCSTANLTDQSNSLYVDPGSWYYYCSPWGTWDSDPCLGYTGSTPCTSTNGVCPADTVHCTRPSSLDGTGNMPTFVGSTVPLNGITFYFGDGSSMTTNGNTTIMYLAFPNPCPGTGTQNGQSVSFQNQVSPLATMLGQPGWPEPSGANGGQYTYPPQALPYIDALAAGQSAPIQSPTTAYVYPNADLTPTGECQKYSPSTYAGDVWQGEMPTISGVHGQHLHFLIFARNAQTAITVNGGSAENFFGILYNPGTQGCAANCLVKLNGGGGGQNGPPFWTGQIIADNALITGNSTVEVFYRPCDPEVESCGGGPGSGLVQ